MPVSHSKQNTWHSHMKSRSLRPHTTIIMIWHLLLWSLCGMLSIISSLVNTKVQMLLYLFWTQPSAGFVTISSSCPNWMRWCRWKRHTVAELVPLHGNKNSINQKGCISNFLSNFLKVDGLKTVLYLCILELNVLILSDSYWTCIYKKDLFNFERWNCLKFMNDINSSQPSASRGPSSSPLD